MPDEFMRYALDSDFIIYSQQARQAPALTALGQLPVMLTDAVWDEVVTTPMESHPVARIEERREMLTAIAGGPTELLPETPEALDFARLASSGLGPGERSLIAYALHHPDVTVVLLDRLALHRAIEELRGERVLSLHGGLRALEPHGLTRKIAQAISDSFCRSNKPHRPPLWW